MTLRVGHLLNDPDIAALVEERVDLVNRDLIQFMQGGLYLVGLGRTLEGLEHDAATDLANLRRLVQEPDVGMVVASFSSEAREKAAFSAGAPTTVPFGKRKLPERTITPP